jgi:hypothetical protein
MSTAAHADNPRPAVPRRRWRRPAVVCLVFVGGLAGLYGYLAYRADQRLQEALAEADRTDPGWRLPDLEKTRPVVPDAENTAVAITAARKLLPGPWEAPIDEALRQRPAPEQQLSPQQTQVLQTELHKLQPALAEARRVADLSRARFDTAWSGDWVGTLLPLVQEARVITNLLRYDVMLRAQEGDADGAGASCRAMVATSHAVGSEPNLIAALVRIACQAVALGTIERCLAQGQPSEAALAQLQQALEAELAEPLLLPAARGERALSDGMLEAISQGSPSPPWFGGPGWVPGSPTADRLVGTLLGGSVRSNRAALLKYMNHLVEIGKLPEDEQFREFKQLSARLPNQTRFVKQIAPAVLKVGEAMKRSRAQLRVCTALVAAERYRLKHGRWPAALADLVPDYLPQVPLDPYDGAPLRYRRLDDGVVIYSVGLDGKDDGGNLNRDRPMDPGTDLGFRLWDVARRRQPAPPVTGEGTPP